MTMDKQGRFKFADLDADLQQVLKEYLRGYIQARDAETAAGKDKAHYYEELTRLFKLENLGEVKAPDPEGTDRVFTIKWVQGSPRIDTSLLRENLSLAGLDPDVIKASWDAAMGKTPEPDLRVFEGRAR